LDPMSSRKHARLRALTSPLRILDPITAKPAPHTVNPFYLSREWRGLMDYLLQQRGRRCERCGRAGCRLFGDHIVELQDGGAALDEANVQILCGSCHTSKTTATRAKRMASTQGGLGS